MKQLKITYWMSTGLVSLVMIYAAIMYITDPVSAEAFDRLGFHSYFRMELAAAKIIGSLLLLAPVSNWLKEWAYAGFVIVFISAFIAHIASGDPRTLWIMPLLFLAIHIVSYVTYRLLLYPWKSPLHGQSGDEPGSQNIL